MQLLDKFVYGYMLLRFYLDPLPDFRRVFFSYVFSYESIFTATPSKRKKITFGLITTQRVKLKVKGWYKLHFKFYKD